MDYTAWLLREYMEHPDLTQRTLAERLGISLGRAHMCLSSARERGLISPDTQRITRAGLTYLSPFKVDAAVILAAGFGSRFVPLSYETPKGLLPVRGERMVERQIRQLHAAGIKDITLVVGYLKEKFEYLIDKFHVKLLYNPDFECKNNISSVYHARHLFYGRNVYLLSSDNWLRENMYHAYEPGAFYSAVYMEGATDEWALTFNKKRQITNVKIGGSNCFVMYGPAYFSRAFSDAFLPELEKAFLSPGTDDYYWETVYMNLLQTEKAEHVPEMSASLQPPNQVYEFENLEELRRFDPYYRECSDNAAMELISRVFRIPEREISGISCLKSGMTNQSFLFTADKARYICRIPGVGTEKLIDRRQECENYAAVSALHISDEVVYFDPENGYKISRYYENARNADPDSKSDMASCMDVLRRLHSSGIRVTHRFDLEEHISFYEALCKKHGEIPFEDYADVKEKMRSLLSDLAKQKRPDVFAHVDPNVDNFVICGDCFHLIDWEYAGMADPLLDVAMCAIYSRYDFHRAADLTALYLSRTPTEEEKKIVFSYMALGGFLWALWAIYKGFLGKRFGDYTLVMYRYAKDGFSNVRNY